VRVGEHVCRRLNPVAVRTRVGEIFQSCMVIELTVYGWLMCRTMSMGLWVIVGGGACDAVVLCCVWAPVLALLPSICPASSLTSSTPRARSRYLRSPSRASALARGCRADTGARRLRWCCRNSRRVVTRLTRVETETWLHRCVDANPSAHVMRVRLSPRRSCDLHLF